jgi:hypothetical protein
MSIWLCRSYLLKPCIVCISVTPWKAPAAVGLVISSTEFPFPLFFVDCTAFDNDNVSPSERALHCLLFHWLRVMCHSLLLASPRYVESRDWGPHFKHVRRSLEYGHLLVHDLDRSWMPIAMHKLDRMEQEHDQQGSGLL